MSYVALIVAGLLGWHGQAAVRGDPVLILHISDPFDFIGANNAPDFVLYDDGLAIYQVEQSPPPTKDTEVTYPPFVVARLDATTYATFLGLATSVPFLSLERYYDQAPQVTDLSMNVIRVWAGDSSKEVMVRGAGAQGPPPFAALFTRMFRPNLPGARPWLPDSIEIELTRVDRPCVQTTPVPWPTDLSPPRVGLDSSVVRYLVPNRELQAVQTLFRETGNWACTPIALGGSHWLLWLRYPFPGESAWYPF